MEETVFGINADLFSIKVDVFVFDDTLGALNALNSGETDGIGYQIHLMIRCERGNSTGLNEGTIDKTIIGHRAVVLSGGEVQKMLFVWLLTYLILFYWTGRGK